MKCKLMCGREAVKSIAIENMCVECYNKHNHAIAMMHRRDEI